MNSGNTYSHTCHTAVFASFQLISLLMLLISLFGATQVLAEDAFQYHLASDDVLSITVFREPELSLNKTRVTTSGSISFPLLGQIHVEGLSVVEVEAELVRRLADGYLKNPRVTVTVIEYRLFYVNGEVKSPGAYSYHDNMTVQKAVTLAGGFSERASQSKITIIYESKPDKPRKADLNDRVHPGDIITVGESFF